MSPQDYGVWTKVISGGGWGIKHTWYKGGSHALRLHCLKSDDMWWTFMHGICVDTNHAIDPNLFVNMPAIYSTNKGTT